MSHGQAMNGGNLPLVTDELLEFEKYPVKFKTSRQSPITLEEFTK